MYWEDSRGAGGQGVEDAAPYARGNGVVYDSTERSRPFPTVLQWGL